MSANKSKQTSLADFDVAPPIAVVSRSRGGLRGQVAKVADFSALDHSFISPLWVRASLGAEFTSSACGCVRWFFPWVLRFSPHLPIGPSHMS